MATLDQYELGKKKKKMKIHLGKQIRTRCQFNLNRIANKMQLFSYFYSTEVKQPLLPFSDC